MSERAALLSLVPPLYAERAEPVPDNPLDAWGEHWTGVVSRGFRARSALRSDLVERVRGCEADMAGLDLASLRAAALELGKSLRRDGLRVELVAHAFAIVCVAAERLIGKRYFDVQLLGGWVLLQGMIAEMQAGEGKTLTAALPACTAALAGIPVHVITVNDYLVTRDAGITRPLYEALGLSVGVVTEQQSPQERQAAYACNITYTTNKAVVFDYLRDRITLSSRNSPLRLRLERLGGDSSRIDRLLLRGLHFAIVDEVDSVLVDEARTPLIISAPAEHGDEERVAQQGIDLARRLRQGEDFTIDRSGRTAALSDAGRRHLEAWSADLGGVWTGHLRREELAVRALCALHLFFRDEHYLVREGKVEIIDEYTGRTMADRSWERGLHQLIEAKEGCAITAPKEPLSRISYQRFFRRYMMLSGMSGTVREVAGELGAVYGLPIVTIPTNRPARRRVLPERVLPREREKWQAIVRRVGEAHATGQPVLLGTRSVAASELASRLLTEAGVPHRLLNAKQNREEAEVVARAGEQGCVTIATNMAGRGTDIELAPGVAAAGGLLVILSERHDSRRIDRQLAGRCARQGDPGCFELIVSLEDSLMSIVGQPVRTVLAGVMAVLGPTLGGKFGSVCVQLAQTYWERLHSRTRRDLAKMDTQTGKSLAFSGGHE